MSQATSPTLEQRLTGWVQHPRWWFVAVAVLLALQIKWWWIPGSDDASYVSMARHFAAGEWQCYGSPVLRYATGYPIVIAPTFWLGDLPFFYISIVHALVGLVLAAGVSRWAKRLAPQAAPLIMLWVVANAGYWLVNTRTLSEPLFMAMLVWSAVCLQMLADVRGKPWLKLVGTFVLTVLVVGFGGWVRAPMALIVGGFWVVTVLQAWRGERPWWRAAVLGGCVTACVAGLIGLAAAIKVGAIQQSGDTTSFFLMPNAETWLEQFTETVRLRFSEVGRLTLPFMIKAYAQPGEWLNINIPIYLAVTGAVAFGWYRAVRDKRDVFLWLVPFHAAFYLVWPFEASVRYTVLLLPVFALCVWKLLAPLRSMRLSVMFVLVMLHAIGSLVWYGSRWKDADLHADWPAIERLADALTDTPDDVLTLGLGRRNIMLCVALNRPTTRIYDEAVIASHTGPLVFALEQGDREPPAGYIEVARVEALNAVVYRPPAQPADGSSPPSPPSPRRP